MSAVTRIGWVVLVSAAAFAAAVQPAAAAKKLPDLVIDVAGLRGQEYAFLDDTSSQIRVKDTTTNDGKKPAAESVTRTYLFPANDIEGDDLKIADRKVPKLKEKKSDRGQVSGNIEGVDIGAYVVSVCADDDKKIKESNEHNNCAVVPGQGGNPRKFYVSKRRWNGGVSGINTNGGGSAQEQWDSLGAALVFQQYARGVFDYGFAGSVTWRESGTDAGGCTWSGEGTRAFTPNPNTGVLHLNVNSGTYEGQFGIDSLFFPMHAQCGEGGFDSQGPKTFYFMATGPQPVLPDPPAIAGSSTNQLVSMAWDFR